MKKIVLFGIAVAAMLTACSNDDVVDVKAPAKATPIGFNTFVENATRAVTGEVKASTIDEFAVWGFTTADGTATQIFNQEAVTRTKKDDKWGDWGYTNTQYWVDGNTYAFAAISPVPTDDKIKYEVGDGVPTGTITFTQDDDAQRDLVYAYQTATGAASNNAAVGFNFNHLLSRVALKVTNSSENSQNTAIVISNIKLTNAISSGEFDTKDFTSATAAYTISSDAFKALKWSELGTANKVIKLGDGTAKIEDGGSVTANGESAINVGKYAKTGWSYIIPYELAPDAGYNITFDVVVYKAVTNAAGTTGADYIRYPQSDSDVYTVTITTTGANAQMNKGYSYVYGLELKVKDLESKAGIEPIKFTVSSVADWDGSSSATPTEVAAELSSVTVTTTTTTTETTTTEETTQETTD